MEGDDLGRMVMDRDVWRKNCDDWVVLDWEDYVLWSCWWRRGKGGVLGLWVLFS